MEKRCPVRNPDIVARKDEKEALLFDPSNGRMLCMNHTGVFVWEKSDGKSTLEDIAAGMVEDFDVSRDDARKDCMLFLKELEEAGFIGYTF